MVYVSAALMGGIVPSGGKAPLGGDTTDVMLINGPIHYDFLLPLTPQTKSAFSRLAAHHPQMAYEDAKWLVIGWGAHDFYTTVGSYRDLSARTVWRGITGDTSVMRVDVAGELPVSLPVRRMTLDTAQYAALLHAITNSFDAWTPLEQSGFSASDVFYPANGQFHILRTCNVWIGQMLREAGVKFGVWTPLPASVSLSHWLYGAR